MAAVQACEQHLLGVWAGCKPGEALDGVYGCMDGQSSWADSRCRPPTNEGEVTVGHVDCVPTHMQYILCIAHELRVLACSDAEVRGPYSMHCIGMSGGAFNAAPGYDDDAHRSSSHWHANQTGPHGRHSSPGNVKEAS